MQLRTWIGLIRSLAIYYNPVRQRQLVRFYRDLLSPGQLAFDIGAHVGSRARAMRRAGARVVACEPQEPFVSFLQRSLPSDIVLVRKAVGPTETMAQMSVSSLHPTVSSLSASFAADAAEAPGFGHVRWDRRQQVQVTTLDRLIADHGMPDLVKIDVEGFELDVLAGLSQPLPLVSVEYLPGLPDRTLAVIDRLEELGNYCFNPVAGEDARFLWPDWRDADAARSWLRGLPRDGRSGDLYARAV
ncbi:FkbM family methyltransferase [Paracoccus rhizosphaerae]|uniref:FkbM family methyltransferase n=1 Tax=Paracoccus rhizosphaerae TaxID=1133347 RepID=A0ABV6CEL4_9RHOB|nr:FkbM family methyltransferase [Paracoccus rhizosphaerae]